MFLSANKCLICSMFKYDKATSLSELEQVKYKNIKRYW